MEHTTKRQKLYSKPANIIGQATHNVMQFNDLIYMIYNGYLIV